MLITACLLPVLAPEKNKTRICWLFKRRKAHSKNAALLCLYPTDSDPIHGLQHARLPCPSLSPRVCSNVCSLSWRCYQTISSSVIPFFFCLQFFSSSESFPMSPLFASSGQSIGASAPVLPKNIQRWFPFGLTGLISCLVLGYVLWLVGFLKEVVCKWTQESAHLLTGLSKVIQP